MSGTYIGARPPAPVELIPPLYVYPSVLPPVAEQHRAHGPHLNASVVVIVVIISVVLILSGLLHLLARCLGRRRRRRGGVVSVREHSPLVSALHGQLQHLFHLHDAGVEQAFIDTLPVFAYGSIRGLKDSTDCAVCLTEFGDDDRLRLLPKCKHAFHLECIDTWLLSNSTCPLCRRSLLPDPHLASSSRHRHGEQLDETASSDMVISNRFISPEGQLSLAHHNTSRRSTINSLHGSIHGSYQNSFRICEALPSSDHDDSESNEIQEIQEDIGNNGEIEEINELEDDEIHQEVELLQTPSPFAPTIRVMDVHGTQRVLKVELGRVEARSTKPQSDSRKLTMNGARSYSMGSYEYIVDPSSWELRMAPTPYPGRPQDWAPSKPTHRSALSDSIPELASAGVTPANDELFWASRGLYNPHTLARVRELLTPIGSDYSAHGFSPFMDASYSPNQGDQWIDIDIERGEIVEEEGCIPESCIPEEACNVPQEASDFKPRSSSLSRLPAEAKETDVSCFRRSFSENSAGMEQAVNALLAKDDGAASAAVCDETVKQGSFSRRFSLNWLMGRDKRMVFAAASPFSVPEEEPQRSRPITI